VRRAAAQLPGAVFGKTMIVEKFRRAHLAVDAIDAADGAANIPVVKAQTTRIGASHGSKSSGVASSTARSSRR
jgi:hypothetical protein